MELQHVDTVQACYCWLLSDALLVALVDIEGSNQVFQICELENTIVNCSQDPTVFEVGRNTGPPATSTGPSSELEDVSTIHTKHHLH